MPGRSALSETSNCPAGVLGAQISSKRGSGGAQLLDSRRLVRGRRDRENLSTLNPSLPAAAGWEGPGSELSTSSRNAALRPPPLPPCSLSRAPSRAFPRAPFCPRLTSKSLRASSPFSLTLSSRPLPRGVSPCQPPPPHRLTPRGGSALGCARVGAPRQPRIAALTPLPPPPPPSTAQPAPGSSSAVH